MRPPSDNRFSRTRCRHHAIAVAAVGCVTAALALAQKPACAADAPILRIEAGGHNGAIHEVLFTSDGRRVVSVGQDKAVRIWDIAAERQVRTLRSQIGPGRLGEVYAAALSGNLLAVGGSDVTDVTTSAGEFRGKGHAFAIRLFDIFHGRVRGLLPGHEESIVALAFSPDGTRLASASYDGTIRLWDPENLRAVRTLKPDALPLGVAFSPDEKQVAAACADGKVSVWETETGKRTRTLDAGSAPLRCVAWSSQNVLAAGSQDHRIRLWNGAAGAARTLTQPDTVTCLAFSPDGKTLLSGSGENASANDLTVRLWSADDGRKLREFGQHTSTILSVAFSPDGDVAASADAAGVIHLWDPDTGRDRERLASTGDSLWAVAWSPDGKSVAWGRTPDGALTESFDLYRNAPGRAADAANWRRAALSLSGKTLAIAPDRRSVEIRDAGGKTLSRLQDRDWEAEEQVQCATFTPAGQVVVGTTYNLGLYSASGQRVARLLGHAGQVLAVAATGNYLASAAADQTVRIWNLGDRPRDIGIAKNALEPLVSLFAGRDGEWVAWNEHYGYYAASPAGDDIIGWHVNRGPRQLAEFHRAFQFRKQFYQPGVVCRLLETGSVPAALKRASEVGPPLTGAPLKLDPGATVAAQVAKLPRVEIVGVEGAQKSDEGYQTTEAEAHVRVRITDADPSKVTVEIHINRPGQEKKLNEIPAAPQPGERLLPATLRPGLNRITVVARNAAGESPAEAITVVYEPPTRAAADPTLYVLAIGVSEYADPAINQQSPIFFAANDADQIADFYQAQQGKLVKKVVVQRLQDKAATRAGIQAALAALKDQVQPEDRVIVFLSGHGFYVGSDFFFAPQDVVLRDLARTGLNAGTMLQTLSSLPCDDVVLMLDHCYSGGVNLQLMEGERARGWDVRNEQGRRLREASLFTLTASMPYQPSYEHASWQHGAFTYALLEALRGRAAASGSNTPYLSLAQTQNYLLERVPALLKSVGLPQQLPKLFYPPTIDDLVPRSLNIARTR